MWSGCRLRATSQWCCRTRNCCSSSNGTLAISVSLGVQHGVPLSDYTSRLTGTRFEPAGFTGDLRLPQATSVVDCIFGRLALA